MLDLSNFISIRLTIHFFPTQGCDYSKVSETAKLATQLTVAVFTTTVHCQDFKDVEGDRITGRRTVPIMFPITSRLVVGLGLPIWSFVLCCIWNVDWFCTATFVAYGSFVGGRFLLLRTREADKQSCKYYSVSAMAEPLNLPDVLTTYHRSGSRCITCFQATGIISIPLMRFQVANCSKPLGTHFLAPPF